MSEMIKGAKGVVYEFARSRRVQQNNVSLIKFSSVDDFSKASRLIGHTVAWEAPSGHKLRGIVISTHGKKGLVKVRFQHGLPSQAMGSEVTIE